MNADDLAAIHRALLTVHDTVGALTFPRCDQDDMFELMERVGQEIASDHPDVQVIGTFLNSIARSLRNQPAARDACLQIEDAIQQAGLPSTWQAGI